WLTSKSPARKGSSVVIKMNTTNVTKGTVVPYTITGIDSNDISSGKLTGNFVIGNNGSDSTTLVLKSDSTNETADVIKTTVKTISLAVPVDQAVAAAVATVTNFLSDTIPYGDIDLIAPGRGANMFYNTVGLNIPSSSSSASPMDRDVRYTW